MNKRSTFRVTHVYNVALDHGDIPAKVVAELIEQAASEYAPGVNVGGGDYFLGSNCDYGDSTVVKVDVEVV